MPELFERLNAKALEDALYDSLSAAVVNGAIRGFMARAARAAQAESVGRASSRAGSSDSVGY